jgi:hypothetical protein
MVRTRLPYLAAVALFKTFEEPLSGPEESRRAARGTAAGGC